MMSFVNANLVISQRLQAHRETVKQIITCRQERSDILFIAEGIRRVQVASCLGKL